MRRLLAALWLTSCLVGVPPALSIQPDEVLSDPVLEQRAREIGKELRCLVCQNQSIDDSDADLARDLRIVVRERLKAGDTDEEVMAFMTARYGDFVLLRPPVQPTTYLLWFGPILLVLGGAIAVVLFFRGRRRGVDDVPLTDAERTRVDELLGPPSTDGRR